MLHAGLDQEAAAMARRLLKPFEGSEVGTAVINAAGCGSILKEYGYSLRDDGERPDRLLRSPSPPLQRKPLSWRTYAS